MLFYLSIAHFWLTNEILYRLDEIAARTQQYISEIRPVSHQAMSHNSVTITKFGTTGSLLCIHSPKQTHDVTYVRVASLVLINDANVLQI